MNGPATRWRAAWACVLALATTSCDRESYLLVHIPAQPAAPIARLSLRADVAGTAHTAELPAVEDADGGGDLSLPSSVIVRLPSDARGPLDLTVDEQLADGTTMFAQELTANIVAGRSEVTLAPGPPWKSTIVTQSSNNLDGLWAAGPSTLYTAGDGGIILRSTDGTTWTPETSSSSQTLASIWASGPNDLYAVGSGATVLHSTGGGAWVKQAVPSTVTAATGLHLVWGSDANHVYIVGDNGVMLGSTNQGQWQPIATGVTTQLNIVWGAQTNHLLISGSGGAIWRSTDNGAHWLNARAADGGYIWSIWGTSPSDIYAAGANGVILRSTDDGASWTAQASGQPSAVTFFGCSGGLANDVYCVGKPGTIVHSSNHGATWVAIPSGVASTLNWVLPVPAYDAMFICGDGGQLLRSF